MTLHIVDVSRHQVERPDAIDLAKAKAFGMNAVNIQLDRGRQEDVLPGWARAYMEGARSLDLGTSTYKWVDARASGAEHARRSLARMRELGGPDGMAHVGDCEEDADERNLRDYIAAMQDGLQRPIALYSGRWWLQSRGWKLADLTPYLMAAPSAGYLPAYPGDGSPHWTVAYGGYTTLAAMQYAVAPLPDTGLCSLSAIRDPAVWAALTGTEVPVPSQGYNDWVKAGKPWNGIARPLRALRDRLRKYGYTVYDIGNDDHMKHVPPEDHTPFSATGWPITSPRWWGFAIDIMPPPAGLPSLQQLGAQMLADAKAGHPGMKWLKYQNWEPERNNGGACVQDRFTPDYQRRTSTDRGHIHQSARSDMLNYAGADDYDPVARVRTPQGDDMYEQYDRDRLSATYGLAVELKDAVAALTAEVEELKKRPAANVSVGGEQLAEVVASAFDSRIPAIVKAVNDDAAERAKE